MNALAHDTDFTIVSAPVTEWLVLTCSGAATLVLADSLNEVGIEAWAPADSGSAVMTRYVFARKQHLAALLSLIHNPFMTYRVWDTEKQKMVIKGHPYFRLMRGLDSEKDWATVRDSQLDALRRIERRRKPRGVVKTVPVGAIVRVDEAGFQGLDGEVLSVRNKFAMVSFAGFSVPVEIGCWLLTEKVDAAPKHR